MLVEAEASTVVDAVALRPASDLTPISVAPFRPKLPSTMARPALLALTLDASAVDLAVDVAAMVASASRRTLPRLLRPTALTLSTAREASGVVFETIALLMVTSV